MIKATEMRKKTYKGSKIIEYIESTVLTQMLEKADNGQCQFCLNLKELPIFTCMSYGSVADLIGDYLQDYGYKVTYVDSTRNLFIEW